MQEHTAAFQNGFEKGHADYFQSAPGTLPNSLTNILTFGKEYATGYLEGWLNARIHEENDETLRQL